MDDLVNGTKVKIDSGPLIVVQKAGELIQCVKVPATNPDELNSMPRTYMVESET